MENVILTIHIIACIVMTIVIMLQKSEGGALGIGGGGGGLMTGRSAAGALVRVTMVFGGIFFLTSLGLTTLANRSLDNRSALEREVAETREVAPDGSGGILDGDTSLLDSLGPATTETPTGTADVPPAEPGLAEPTEEPVDNP